MDAPFVLFSVKYLLAGDVEHARNLGEFSQKVEFVCVKLMKMTKELILAAAIRMDLLSMDETLENGRV